MAEGRYAPSPSCSDSCLLRQAGLLAPSLVETRYMIQTALLRTYLLHFSGLCSADVLLHATEVLKVTSI
jgi:hypothetical protein